MGSVMVECVRFIVYANDHLPRHVHGVVGRTRVIVELLLSGDIKLAARTGAIRPRNAKKADVRKVLALAAAHSDELNDLWEKIHGKS
jgi:uncharacterized protein DUF4160